jgi:hypothetical protein
MIVLGRGTSIDIFLPFLRQSSTPGLRQTPSPKKERLIFIITKGLS